VVAGVPPDYFSRTGQRWGNPLYRWELHEEDDFAWWRSRIRTALSRTDLLRIDHFRGFSACFAISAASPTAERGNWEPVPGRELFSSLQGEFPTMPFIAEDLGIIDEDVRELMARFGLPGMNVLLFAFGGDQGTLTSPTTMSLTRSSIPGPMTTRPHGDGSRRTRAQLPTGTWRLIRVARSRQGISTRSSFVSPISLSAGPRSSLSRTSSPRT